MAIDHRSEVFPSVIEAIGRTPMIELARMTHGRSGRIGAKLDYLISNHGGRQLDGAPPPIELVAPVKEEVGDAIEVYCDGGIRRGSDILKAVALGADAAMVGRAYLYGLAAAGEAGVDHALKLLRDGLERSMALIGCQSIADVDSRYVTARPDSRQGSMD